MTLTRTRLMPTTVLARLTVLTGLAMVLLSPTGGTFGASPAAAAAPAQGSVATTSVLQPTARPSYARTIPRASNVLRPYGRALKIYEQPAGRTLITLPNPLLPGIPLLLAEYGTRVPGWIPVSLPVRPNNTIGWVKASNVRVEHNPWRVDIYRSQHRLVVWNGNTVFGVFPVAVGKPSTPTPRGVFYILRTLASSPSGDFGPVIMATSGFSEVFRTFGPQGGDAATAIHGTNRDSSVGTSASHGCIRMHNADAALLGRTLPEGTVVRVT